jgi:hypothetical protein
LGFGRFNFRGFGFFGGAFKVPGEQFFQDLFVGQIGGLAVAGGNGGVQFLMGEIEPRGTLVVKFGKRALFEFGRAIGVTRFKARVPVCGLVFENSAQ